MSDERLLTKKQIAERLQISTKTIERLVSDGVLGCHYVGTHPRFSERHITEYLSSCEKPARREFQKA